MGPMRGDLSTDGFHIDEHLYHRIGILGDGSNLGNQIPDKTPVLEWVSTLTLKPRPSAIHRRLQALVAPFRLSFLH